MLRSLWACLAWAVINVCFLLTVRVCKQLAVSGAQEEDDGLFAAFQTWSSDGRLCSLAHWQVVLNCDLGVTGI